MMHSQIIRRTHDKGYLSAIKIEQIVRKDYWIQDLKAKVKKVVRNCVPCILAERQYDKREGLLHPIEKGKISLDIFHLDHLGPLPSIHKRYRYILAIVDAIAKFVWLYAIRTTSTAEDLACLRKQSRVFGNPRRIISGRGSAFTSTNDFREYYKEEGVQHILTTTVMTRANRQVERSKLVGNSIVDETVYSSTGRVA